MKDERLNKLIKRVEQNGIALTKPSEYNRKLSKKTDFIVFNNRRLNQSVIINEKKLKKLLGDNYL